MEITYLRLVRKETWVQRGKFSQVISASKKKKNAQIFRFCPFCNVRFNIINIQKWELSYELHTYTLESLLFVRYKKRQYLCYIRFMRNTIKIYYFNNKLEKFLQIIVCKVVNNQVTNGDIWIYSSYSTVSFGSMNYVFLSLFSLFSYFHIHCLIILIWRHIHSLLQILLTVFPFSAIYTSS